MRGNVYAGEVGPIEGPDEVHPEIEAINRRELGTQKSRSQNLKAHDGNRAAAG